jgi:RND superfamily putative drug exporter
MNLSTQALANMSANHPWRTIVLWVVLLVAAVVVNATLLGDALTTEFSYTNMPDSKKGDELLEERLRGPRRVNEIVVVRSETLTVDEPEFIAKVDEVFGTISGLGADIIEGGVNYYLTQDPSMVSADRHTTIMPFILSGTFDDAVTNVEQIMELVREADRAEGFQVLIAGEASISFESNEIAEKDMFNVEVFGIPIALVILLIVFGAVVAAVTPIFAALIAIVIAIALSALIGQLFQLSFFVVNMIFMIGLAVGIDYTLFIVYRYREERARGYEKLDAISWSGSTASRAVFFSGMTVVLALIGMLIIPTNIFQSLATGAILVVIMSVAASLTLLPAALGLMGDRVNSWRVPIVGRNLMESHSDETQGGFWNWITALVMAHPVVSLLLSVGLLGAAAVPVFQLDTGFNGISSMPDGLATKEAFLILDEEFSFGVVSPLEIVVDGEVNSPAVQSAVESLNASLATDPLFMGAPAYQANEAGDLALVSVPVSGESASDDATTAVRNVRDIYASAAFAGVDARVYATGAPAFNVDFYDITDRFTPIVFGIVLGLSFILLTVVFRSIVIPIKAILMNLLSVGAAYGLLVLVFQKGFAADFLGFYQSDVIDAWIPLFLFSVLFGLSMDYHVFLLSRIRERYDQTQDNAGSVAYGLRSTGKIITGAALIMVAVFGGFAMGDMVMFQQVGFGLGVAVFLDATIIRSILVPAGMRLLGNLNWYLPSVLSWLPDVRVEVEETATSAVTAD